MAEDRFKQNRQLAYDLLKQEGYTDIGDDAEKLFEDRANAELAYELLSRAGYTDLGADYNEFASLLYAPESSTAEPEAPAVTAPAEAPTPSTSPSPEPATREPVDYTMYKPEPAPANYVEAPEQPAEEPAEPEAPMTQEEKDRFLGKKSKPTLEEMWLAAGEMKEQVRQTAKRSADAVENPKLARYRELVEKYQSDEILTPAEIAEMNELYKDTDVNPTAKLDEAIARRKFNESPQGQYVAISQKIAGLDRNSDEYKALEKKMVENSFYQQRLAELKGSAEQLYNDVSESIPLGETGYSFARAMSIKAGTYTKVNDPELNMRSATARMLAEAVKTLKDPSKYEDTTWLQRRGRFAKEYGKEMVNPQMWLGNVFKIMDAKPIRDTFKKIIDNVGSVDENLITGDELNGILTKDEQDLIKAYFLLGEAQSMRPDVAGYVQSGRSAAQSTKFIIEMLISGEALGFNALEKGLYDTASKKAAASALGKWAEKAILGGGARAIGAKALGAVAKLGGKTVVNGLVSVPAVLTHGSMWAGVADNMSKIDDKGQLVSGWKPVGDAWFDAWKERFTETMGEAVFQDFIGSIVRGAGLVGRKALGNGIAGKMADEIGDHFGAAVDWLNATKPAELVRAAKNSGLGKAVQYVAEGSHFDGFLPEMGEEGLGAVLDAMKQGSAEPLRDFFTWENLLITGESFLPMYIMGGGVSAAGLAAGRVNYGLSEKKLGRIMKKYGYTDDQVRYLVDQAKDASIDEIGHLLGEVGVNITNSRFGEAGRVVLDSEQKEVIDTFREFLQDAVTANMYDEMRKEQEAQQRDAVRQEIEDRIGSKFYTDGENGEPATVTLANIPDENGNPRQAYILGELNSEGKYAVVFPDGSKEFVSPAEIAPLRNEDGTPVVLNGQIMVDTTTQDLDAYLSGEVMRQRQQQDGQRNLEKINDANTSLRPAIEAIRDDVTYQGKKGYLTHFTDTGATFLTDDEDSEGVVVSYAELAKENGIVDDSPMPTDTEEEEADGVTMAQSIAGRRALAKRINDSAMFDMPYTIEQGGKTYTLAYAMPGSINATTGMATGIFKAEDGTYTAFDFDYHAVIDPQFEVEETREPEPAPAPAPEAPAEPAEEKPVIPIDEKSGEPVYDAPGVTPIAAYEDIYGKLSEKNADAYVIEQSDAANKAVSDAEKLVADGDAEKAEIDNWDKKPGEGLNAFLKRQDEAKAKVDERIKDARENISELRRKAAFWAELRDVAEENVKRRANEEAIEKKRQADIEKYGVDTSTFKDRLTPETAEEAVAEYLGNSDGIIDLDDARKEWSRKKGGRIPAELFRHSGNGGILTKKGGRSIQAVAGDIVAHYGDSVKIDEAQVRDLIIDYLARFTKTEMRDMIFNNRLDETIKAKEAAENAPEAEEVEVQYNRKGRTLTAKYTITKDADGFIHISSNGSSANMRPEEIGLTAEQMTGPKEDYNDEAEWKDVVDTINEVGIRVSEAVIRPDGTVEVTDTSNGLPPFSDAISKKIAAKFFHNLFTQEQLAEIEATEIPIPASEAVEEAPQGTEVPEAAKEANTIGADNAVEGGSITAVDEDTLLENETQEIRDSVDAVVSGKDTKRREVNSTLPDDFTIGGMDVNSYIRSRYDRFKAPLEKRREEIRKEYVAYRDRVEDEARADILRKNPHIKEDSPYLPDYVSEEADKRLKNDDNFKSLDAQIKAIDDQIGNYQSRRYDALAAVEEIYAQSHPALGYDAESDTWSGVPDGVEIFTARERNRLGYVYGYTPNSNVDLVNGNGNTFARVWVDDEFAETPAKIVIELEKEGYDVGLDGEHGRYVDFDTYDEAMEFEKQVRDIEKRVHQKPAENAPAEAPKNNPQIPSESAEKSVTSQGEEEAREKFTDTVAKSLERALETGEKPYKSITELRKEAKAAGMEVDERGATDILLQELVEVAIVRTARDIVESGKYGLPKSREQYDAICRLYAIQPTIAQRSSNRVAMQQYSTPLPMSYAAQMYAHDGSSRDVLEPTAGNGMLLFAVPASKVHANELDGTRKANLDKQGFKEVTQNDATEPFTGKYDAVIANPPFGSHDAVTFDGKAISGLDPIITLRALDAMKDDGRAAIIIGGNVEWSDNGAWKTKKAFFSYLYDHYNVQGVVNMSGDLYAKQGTTYPTMMILINGRRSEAEREQSRVYPPVADKAQPTANTQEELYDIVNNIINDNRKTDGNEVVRTKVERQSADSQDEQPSLFDNERGGESSENGADAEGPGRGASNDGGAVLPGARGTSSGRTEEEGGRVPVRVAGERRGDGANVPNGEPGGAGRGGSNTGRGSVQGTVRGEDNQGSEGIPGGNAGRESAESLPGGKPSVRKPVRVDKEKRKVEDKNLPYVQHSGAKSLESVAPASMVESMDAAIQKIEQEVGKTIDDWMVEELGYRDTKELYGALAAEQIDSVAMAIYQMKKGQAMIIGDQTGVGKGRQMAALIRWANRHGKKPVFMTQKASLFSDIYRDLKAVGCAELNPLIINSVQKERDKETGEMKHGDRSGVMLEENEEGKLVEVYKSPSPKVLESIITSGEVPEEYDYVVLTYSQLNNGDAQSRSESHNNKEVKQKDLAKANYIRQIVNDGVLLMDESHTAAGKDSNTGAFLQSVMPSVSGVTFASATFAKSPETMPLYAIKSAMSEANVDPKELISMIKRGGVTLQELMARALTGSGQMVRRERDMSDVQTDWETIDDPATAKRARENYDKAIKIFNDIISFQQRFITPLIDEISGELAIEMSTAQTTSGNRDFGVDNPPFVSQTYNFTKQLMLALKVDAIVDEVVKEIQAGRHPVIALENTFGSLLDDYREGDTIEDTSFSGGLIRSLDHLLQYTVRDEDGQHQEYIDPSELGAEGKKEYYALQDRIREATKDIFMSPLDAITMKLQEKGYRVGEITGRKTQVVKGADGYVVTKRTADAKQAVVDFNSGKNDVLIINKSGSTGISLHASSLFKDQRQRSMIIAQPLGDINDYMQMIGRIDRTGQVHRGYYINLSLPVPAETRFNMMLAAKLKSLNANTTTDQEGNSGSVEAPDFLNKYGSQVVIEYLRDNPDVFAKLVDTGMSFGTKLNRVTTPAELETYTADEDDAKKVTGRVALFPVEEQEKFYDEIGERYNALIKYLDETGENTLKITTLPLKAKTLARKVGTEGRDPNGTNPFAQNSYVERVEVDVLKKPMKADEIRKTRENLNGGKDESVRVQELLDRVEAQREQRLKAEDERYNREKEKVQKEVEKQWAAFEAKVQMNDEATRKAERRRIYGPLETVEQRHINTVSSINSTHDIMLDRFQQFNMRDTYLIHETLVGGNVFEGAGSPGLFLGFKTSKPGASLTPSTSFAVFATLDGRRRIEIKFTAGDVLDEISNYTNQNYFKAAETTIENWDNSISNATREERYILTGNILQAWSDASAGGVLPGRLISYTDIDGNIKDGILMNSTWQPGSLRSAGAPISSAYQLIKDLPWRDSIESTDGEVEIQRDYGFHLRVPKSKKAGAKYYDDQDLKSLVGGEFYQSRGKFEASIPDSNLVAVLARLSELGVRVQTESNESDWEQVNQQPQSEDESDLFRLREKPAPKKSQKVYKLMRLGADGKLYPLFIDSAAPVELGNWYDADSPDLSMLKEMPSGVFLVDYENGTYTSLEDYKKERGEKAGKYPTKDDVNEATDRGLRWVKIEDTARGQRRYEGETRKYSNLGINGSGGVSEFAMRPGWHAGSLPSMRQIGKGPGKNLRDDSFVWVEGSVAADVNYQDEADRNPDKDIPTHIPENGYYMKATNANKAASQADRIGWYVAGAFRPERIISDSEARDIIDEWNETHPGQEVEYDYPRESGQVFNAETMRLESPEAARKAENLRNPIDRAAAIVAVQKMAKELGVEFEEDPSLKAKGAFSPKTGKIRINIDAHANTADLQATLLHEAVAHYGLRKLLGKQWKEVRKRLYDQASPEIKAKVDAIAKEDGLSTEVAMEEYIAQLAEDGRFDAQEESFWQKVVSALKRILRKLGMQSDYLTDEDFRALLYASYRNLQTRGAIEKAAQVMTYQALRRNADASHEDNGPEDDGPGGRKRPYNDGDSYANKTDLSSEELEALPEDVRGEVIEEETEDLYRRSRARATAMTAAGSYNQNVRTVRSALNEVVVDEYAPVDALTKALADESGIPLSDSERVSDQLRETGGKAMHEIRQYDKHFLRPMWDAVGQFRKNAGISIAETERYIGLKSGLERNVVLAARDARKDYEEEYQAVAGEAEAEIRKINIKEQKQLDKLQKQLDSGKISDVTFSDETTRIKMESDAERKEKQDEIDTAKSILDAHIADIGAGTDERFLEYRKKDYSAITTWAEEDDLETAEHNAQVYVDDIESRAGRSATSELWKRINAATKETLRFQYEHDMITRQQYNDVAKMMKYYVPMRGFEEDTAEDLFNYYVTPQGSAFQATLQSAKGRKTMYEGPLGNIGAMHSSAISQGIKNQAKLSLLSVVRNRKDNSLATVTRAWFVKSGEKDDAGKPIFVLAYPSIPEGADFVTRQAIIESFEEDMREKYKKGDAYNAHREVDLHGGVVAFEREAHKNEHIVKVREGGREYGIIINGNPAAAQAINGVKRGNGAGEKALDILRTWTRFLSQMFTTLSVPFWVSNFQRDHGQGLTNAFIRNDKSYLGRYIVNRWKAYKIFPMIVGKNGLDKALAKGDEVALLYQQYLENGGPMGQNRIEDNEYFERQMKRYLDNSAKQGIVKGATAVFDVIGGVGEAIETITRFAVFMTSMESGRSIHESISDAKEISTNFARKGSGRSFTKSELDRMTHADGTPLSNAEKKFVSALSIGVEICRASIPFFNAAVQGLQNKVVNYRDNTVKTLIADSIYLMLGLGMHMLLSGAGGDDDKEKYSHTSDYLRRNNILNPIGDGVYAKWALPQEYRVMFALGDILASAIMQERPVEDLAADSFGALMQLSPIGVVTDEVVFNSADKKRAWQTVLTNVSPGTVAPVLESVFNRDFKGARIYNEGFNENLRAYPGWTKALPTTGSEYVAVAKWLNEVTGGNDVERGWINLNPAIVEHLVESYFSGPYQIVVRAPEAIAKGVKGDAKVRDIPLLNRIILNTNDNQRDAYYSNMYYYFKDKSTEASRIWSEYKERTGDRVEKFLKSDDYRYMMVFKQYETMEKAVRKQGKIAEQNGDQAGKDAADAEIQRLHEDIAKRCLDIYFDRNGVK